MSELPMSDEGAPNVESAAYQNAGRDWDDGDAKVKNRYFSRGRRTMRLTDTLLTPHDVFSQSWTPRF